jgi:hypothetical protein
MIFDFKCMKCQRVEMDVYMKFEHFSDDHPSCCGTHMAKHFTKAPTVHWKDYDLPDGGFKACHDGTVITSRKQNRDYMERNGLGDANEEYEKPTRASENKEVAAGQAAIDQITPTHAEMQQLKEVGIVDSDGNLNQGDLT